MYKLSQFNYFPSFNRELPEKAVVFNSLTRKLLLVDKTFLEQPDLDDHSTLEKLYNAGVFVPAGKDEIEDLETIIDEKKYVQRRLTLTIIPTNACNFRCVYCYQPVRHAAMGNETADHILRWLSLNLRYYNELNLNWFGGEPLLCKQIMIDMMKSIQLLCKQHGVAMVASVTTNGYLLDVETFQKLVKYGVLFYQITIDGTEEIHNRQRPHMQYSDSYKRIIQNLKTIKSLPKRLRFEIGLRINISGMMRPSDIYSFVDEMALHFSDKRFVIIWQWVRDWGGKRLLQHGGDSLTQEGRECIKYMSYAESKGLKSPKLLTISTGTDVCEAFYKHGYVFNYDGSVMKCPMRIEDKETNQIGVIDNQGTLIIDSVKERRWLKRDVINEKCRSCVFLPLCMTNRCHFSNKIKDKLVCIEYKDLIETQIAGLYKSGNIEVL